MRADPPDREEITDTQPSPSSPSPSPGPWHRVRWLLLLIPIAALLAALVGYLSGASAREAARENAVLDMAQSQFELGLADLEAARYELARQRFEYVIELNPAYPGAAELLVEALVHIQEPVALATSAPTPTPNLAPVEEIFAQAEEAFAAGEWTRVIDTLLAARAKDPTYRAIDADGMMYVALRNRGLHLIRNDWELEAGLYDLSRAERFGPLDKEAEDWRFSARYYLLANSYFGLNWGLSSDLFLELCVPAAVWDSCDRASVSIERYADQLDEGDPCEAVREYEAWEWSPDLPILQPVYDVVALMTDRCAAQSAPPPVTETPTPEGTPVETPSDTPVP
jgi:tetratricopeptide (TPR) repeat protein